MARPSPPFRARSLFCSSVSVAFRLIAISLMIPRKIVRRALSGIRAANAALVSSSLMTGPFSKNNFS